MLWNVYEIFLSKTVLPGCWGGLVNELLDEPRKLWRVDFFTSFLVGDQSVNYKTNSHWKESHLHLMACIKI